MEGLSNQKIQQIKQKAAIAQTRRFLEQLQEKNPGLKTTDAAKILEWLDNPEEFNLNLGTAIDRIQSGTNTLPPEIIRDFALAIYEYYNMRSKWSEFVELGKLGLDACRKIGNSDSMGIVYPALCNNLGMSYRMMGNKEKAMSFYKDVLEKAIRNEEKSDAFTKLCDIYRLLDEPEKAFDCGRKAVELAKQIPDLERQARGLEFTGLTYRKKREFDEAIQCFEKALELHKKTGNLPEQARALCFLADTLMYVGTNSSTSKAITYYKQALEKEIKLGNKTGLGRIYLGMGYTLYKQNKYQEARDTLYQAYAYNKEIRFWRGTISSKVKLVESYVALGNLEEALNQANDVCEGIEHLTVIDQASLGGFSATLLQLAKNLQQSGNTQKANKFTQTAIQFAEAAKDNESLQEAKNLLNKWQT